ncbi:MAG: LysM peptidoglycan-binding domain-containing M23 family metallopeptidase [Chloroflexota bacterium]
MSVVGLLVLFSTAAASPSLPNHSSSIAQEDQIQTIFILPGDTWDALAWRFQTTPEALKALNPHPNFERQPPIGAGLAVPITLERTGSASALDHSLLEVALRNRQNIWSLTHLNGYDHPYEARLMRPLWVPSADIPRSYPRGIASLELSHIPGQAGEGMGLRGAASRPFNPTALQLGTSRGKLFLNVENGQIIGLLSTGAFFYPGAPHLTLQGEVIRQSPICRRQPERSTCQERILWSQPLSFEDKLWTYNDITLTGAAAQIDAESIAAERARLFQLWEVVTPNVQWDTPFFEPVSGYLSYSSLYGARRSYNGGPYSSYHEGLDFAAYRGSEVTAPSSGTVALAESLYVRGGAVIIDHGLGIYSGYYHLDEVLVGAGQSVAPGTLLGKVGTTGLSTGPHLHWDLLVNGEWVDPLAWREKGTACWLAEGWGIPCQE